MWIYRINTDSDYRLCVVCKTEEQAIEVFKRDLDHFIAEYYESMEEFNQCYNYDKILEEQSFEIEFEFGAWIEEENPLEVERKRIAPNCFDGWNTYTYEQYVKMGY